VAYTGTHDNPPSRCWYESLPADQQANVTGYLKSRGREVPEVARQLIHIAWSSPAALAIAPLQDVLNLGCESRMNLPGRAEDNWKWRSTEQMLCGPSCEFLSNLTTATNRRCLTPKERKEASMSHEMSLGTSGIE